MENKYRKEKDKIRIQIAKSLDVYKGMEGFDFFDSSASSSTNELADLDDNDLQVLFMKLNNSNSILLTIKCLFIKQEESITRIDGGEIENVEFLNNTNKRSKAKASDFENLRHYKTWLYSGDFRISLKDKTEIVVFLPNHDFGFCLLKAIEKLKFITRKYEGI